MSLPFDRLNQAPLPLRTEVQTSLDTKYAPLFWSDLLRTGEGEALSATRTGEVTTEVNTEHRGCISPGTGGNTPIPVRELSPHDLGLGKTPSLTTFPGGEIQTKVFSVESKFQILDLERFDCRLVNI